MSAILPSATQRAGQSALGDGGASEGRQRTSSAITTMYSSACVMPGTIAAVNSVPIDCCAMMPNTINAPDGGIIWPSVPPAATAPVASASE